MDVVRRITDDGRLSLVRVPSELVVDGGGAGFDDGETVLGLRNHTQFRQLVSTVYVGVERIADLQQALSLSDGGSTELVVGQRGLTVNHSASIYGNLDAADDIELRSSCFACQGRLPIGEPYVLIDQTLCLPARQSQDTAQVYVHQGCRSKMQCLLERAYEESDVLLGQTL